MREKTREIIQLSDDFDGLNAAEIEAEVKFQKEFNKTFK